MYTEEVGAKRRERITSILWGVFFSALTVLCVVGIVASDHVDWGFGGWAWRVAGTLVLGAAAAGSFLPDWNLSGGSSLELSRTDVPADFDGFMSTYDCEPRLAAAVQSLKQGDPGPAHTMFHTSREGAWGIRFVLVRLALDRYVGTWSALAKDGMLDGLVTRTHGDPLWLLVRGLDRGQAGRSVDFEEAERRDPADPTPSVLRLYAMRARAEREAYHAPPSEQEAMRARGRAAAGPAYLHALSLAPELFEAHEQMLHLLSPGAYGSDAHALDLARRAAASAPPGTDQAFLPAYAHYVIYASLPETQADPARPSRATYFQWPGVAEEVAVACARSFDAPSYVPTHRTLRLLHIAAVMHYASGDLPRLRGELARAGPSFDPDLWVPVAGIYPAKAFADARKRVNLA